MTRIQDTVEAVAAAIIEQKDYLTALDAEIGDGDHGLNMARGFEAVREAMDEMGDESRPGPVFKAIGEALLENVGGAAGPLYATGFLKAAEACDDHTNFSTVNVEKGLGAAIARRLKSRNFCPFCWLLSAPAMRPCQRPPQRPPRQ